MEDRAFGPCDRTVASRPHDEMLIVMGAGSNVVRLLPPFITGKADVGEAVARLDSACSALTAA